MINFKKIYVAGHKGLVGSAIVRKLKKDGYENIITIDRKRLDLTNFNAVLRFLKKTRPDFIFIAAAKVGGIISNSRNKADFITQNLLITTNLIYGAYLTRIKNLIFLGSSCVYPKNCKQPIKEEYLLSGNLEETNDAYAISKIRKKMCRYMNSLTQIICVLCQLIPLDLMIMTINFIFPSLIKKIHNLKINKKIL